MKNISNSNFIVVAHILTSVPSEDLKQYLINKKVKNLLYIGHPLYYMKGRPGSFYEVYKKGILLKKIEYPNLSMPALPRYFIDFFLTTFWVFRHHKKWDIVISLDNLNTISALFLRLIGQTKKVIYYTIDYTPQRFVNSILNNFYHYLDKVCLKYADLTWNVSPRIAEGREKIQGLEQNVYNKQIVVPIGVWPSKKKSKNLLKIHKHTLVYAGGLSKHQGVQLVLKAIPLIVKKIKDFKFIVIGLGGYESELKKMCKRLKIEKYVEFKGYIEKHEDVMKIISQCGLAVAMYNKNFAKWSYYADPSKIKAYLGAGVPVITTNLTYLAQELVDNKCGLVVPYNHRAFALLVVEYLEYSYSLKSYREHAIKFSNKFAWDTIFDAALTKLYKF
ncbi:hypothetical protein COV24_05185 [candidate division WWE3 bacterium CG10_big_fil_rev_8_21_14_0_10_32_10]|uniref:Glycosyl transferase family 1 domain-containing protein n=1 Tax=candidate division WWE3 bacterium CG10_big_fil_rev_8_21_14_0_10_32_10 TaxID=1975090 RepID=A0A2H0R962_UNCKA|nr:MAG: hypothetical protein COV24_05185 [candidate division WWE3 bacterium CG10_big_fil_rev_8_21_14_0_10_32_10]